MRFFSRSTNAIIAPVGQPTEFYLPATADASLFAGANNSTNYGFSPVITVSTAAGAAHEATAAGLLRFDLPAAQPAAAVVMAVLELTIETPPAQDMLITVIGVRGDPVWAEGALPP